MAPIVRLFAAPILALALCLPSAGAFADHFTGRIASLLADGLLNEALSEEDRDLLEQLQAYYERRVYEPLWVTHDGVNGNGRVAVNLIRESYEEGLRPNDYNAARLDELVDATAFDKLSSFEIALSQALVRYASDVGSGRVSPDAIDNEYHAFSRDFDVEFFLTGLTIATDIADYLDQFVPGRDEYDRLKQALAEYREIGLAGGWGSLGEGETIKPDMTDSRVPALREILTVMGDYPVPGGQLSLPEDPTLYDAALVDAVKRFQYRHGLEQDGAVGPATRAALNVPVEDRIEMILLNMERRRWMPNDRGQRHVFINLADFFLKVVDEPKTIFTSHVVVGAEYFRTPVFSEEMTYLEFNPYWNVPPSIGGNEILPKVQEDPGYLSANRYEVMDGWGGDARVVDPSGIDWSQYSRSTLPYRFRQLPGEGNALGVVKFMFPNRFNIYLHDTPAKSLFQRANRAFSHGCIRVEKPLELADLILGMQSDAWTADRIRETIDSGERTIVTLSTPIPVHITYLTAWANKDGTVHFREDVYDRDQVLRAALFPES